MPTPPPERYWLILPNGARQLIDPRQFDLSVIEAQAVSMGGKLVAERLPEPPAPVRRAFEPPISAVGPLFRARLSRLHVWEVDFLVDINVRPTARVLGGYYKRRRLVRIYLHDRQTGRRPLEELFDTFLHEVAHHLEYTEPHSFNARACGRVPGRMHSQLFWRILGELKGRWMDLQRESS